ncbi:response regulator [Falsirhodobacter sp. 1013]|uniref:response regulator n=1 Tax=Falsirhodobacter sp. 1013 TaxID=3417566 RepID=UPI003EBD2C05
MTVPAILVVEDQLLLRMDAMFMIEDAGFLAVGARDTADALRILEDRTDIRVIFTDIDMGDGPDGLWLAACVRDRWPPIHIIVTSGHRRVTADMMPDGALFLDKPYTEEQVLTHVRRLAA